MSETDNEVSPAPEEAPKKPRKPRKPRAPKAEAAPEQEARTPRGKALPHVVKLDGKVIHVTGRDVYVRKMDAAALALHGIKDVQGTLGKPCAEPLTITFKSPKAASTFFAASFTTENEDEEMIVAGGKTEWEGDGLSDLLG